MKLHVLTGCRELLRPLILDPQATGGLIGPSVQAAGASWLQPGYGDEYHDFLQDEPGDRRTMVMAHALKENFGERIEPLLVLTNLLDDIAAEEPEDSRNSSDVRRSQLTVLQEILDCGLVDELELHAIALPSKADPDGEWAIAAGIVPGVARERIERLKASLAETGAAGSIRAHVIEATPDITTFGILYNNALAHRFARRLDQRLQDHGWDRDQDRLAEALAEVLAEWNGRGIYMGLPLPADNIESTAERLFDRILQS
jgi:hypothetical protein